MKEELRKIRVMHIAQAGGGVDRYIKMLLKHSNDKYENVLVVSHDYKEEEYVGLVEKFISIKMKRKIGINDLKAVCKIRKLIKKYKPDVVYAHSSKAGAIARLANIGLKNRYGEKNICIYNPHGWSFNMDVGKIKKNIYILIEKIMSLFCNKIICISDAEKESAIKYKICPDDKLKVIYNGIEIDSYNTKLDVQINRPQLGIPENSYVIGMVGRISWQKSPDIFIKVCKKILDKIPNAYFIIVGDGEMKTEIIEYAKKNKFDNKLCITGWVDNPLSYIKLFDIACLLSRWEGFGLVLAEYMLCKKPIVASAVDAIPNIIIDKKNGLLVNISDMNDILQAIMKIYNNEQFKNEIVINAYNDVVTKFDIKRVALETENLIFNML